MDFCGFNVNPAIRSNWLHSVASAEDFVPAVGRSAVYLDTKKPRVCIKGPEIAKGDGYENLDPQDYFQFYELKSAADNLLDANGQTFNEKSMRRKIRAQLDTLIEAGVRNVVLSAFGCGAFGNPASEVAKIYKEELEKSAAHFDDVVFAIYYAGYGPDNYDAFQKVLDKKDLKPEASFFKRPSLGRSILIGWCWLVSSFSYSLFYCHYWYRSCNFWRCCSSWNKYPCNRIVFGRNSCCVRWMVFSSSCSNWHTK